MKNFYIGCDNCTNIQEITNHNVKKEIMLIEEKEYVLTLFTCLNCGKIYVVQIDTLETEKLSLDNIKTLDKIKKMHKKAEYSKLLESKWKETNKLLKTNRNSLKRKFRGLEAKKINNDKKIKIEYLEAYIYE